MRTKVGAAAWRLGIFTVVCSLAVVAELAIFAQLRLQSETIYRAAFANVTGLESGNFVRVAGVEVGKVKKISISPDATVTVEFSTDSSVVLTEGTKAVIRYENLVGARYLELQEGVGGLTKLAAGQTIPLDRTEPALDLDALIGGFRPLFRALDPQQVNALSGQLIAAFQDQGATIGSFLDQTAALSNTLADQDELIGQVVTNLDTVLGSLGDQSSQFAKGVDSLATLLATLAARKTDISNGLAHANDATATIAALLTQARPPLQNTVHQTDRVASIVVADHDYFDDLLNTLPDAYQALARQGMYGDFFSFYLCEVSLKLNGKGGQPVYVKLAGQASGRCTPK
jgi:phospholipid/cholesterol/gamma-HCH transport system substrate-binding protein